LPPSRISPARVLLSFPSFPLSLLSNFTVDCGGRPPSHRSRQTTIQPFRSPCSVRPPCLFPAMKLLVALYFFLHTQLSQAAPSNLSTSQDIRSLFIHSGEVASRSSNTNNCRPRVASSWYASWHSDDFPLSAVSWSKYNSVTYAFA
jgi:hypothetical protein